MVPKKPPSKPKAKPSTKPVTHLRNLAARPPAFDDTVDEQLVDQSGVFRVTSQIAQAQTGHGEDSSMRFPNDSLAMAAQRDGFRDPGPATDDAIQDRSIDDETARAEKRQRLATLAARNQTRRRR